MNEEMLRRKVVAVDDHEEILNVICEIMRENYDVYGFTTPGNVLSQDKSLLKSIDLFIIDVRIQTHRNGIDLASSISELDRYVPFLIISGYQPPINEIMSMPVTNITDFLAKPFDRFALLNRAKILIMAAESMRNISEESDRLRFEWRKILEDHSAMLKALSIKNLFIDG